MSKWLARLRTVVASTLRTLLHSPELPVMANDGEFQPTDDPIENRLRYDHNFSFADVDKLYSIGDHLECVRGMDDYYRNRHVFEALRLAANVVVGPKFQGNADAALTRLKSINRESGYIMLIQALIDAGIEQTETAAYTGDHIGTAVLLLEEHSAMVRKYLTSQGLPFMERSAVEA